MMTELLTVLTALPAQVLCLLPLWNQRKYGVGKTLGWLGLMDLLLFPVAAFLLHRYLLLPNTVLFPLLLAFFGGWQRCLKCAVYKSLAVFFAVCSLLCICRNIACAIESRVMPEAGADALSVESALIQLGLNALVVLLLFLPLRRYGAKLIDSLDLPGVWYMTLPFSLVLLGINLFLRPLKYETLFVNNVFRAFLLSVFATLILWALLCVMFYQIVTAMLASADQKMKIRLLEMQESQFVSQQRYMEASARARHDFRQNVLTMKNLCQEGNYSALEKYIDEYYNALPRAETAQYCRNHALNATLNYYAGKAAEEKIRTGFRVDIPDVITVSDVDLCTVTGNILENAVNACLELPEEKRYIHLTILTRNGNRLYLVATNSHAGKIRKRGGNYLSSHRQGEGIGLKSVMETAAKYGGSAEFSHDENEFFSNVMIPLAAG